MQVESCLINVPRIMLFESPASWISRAALSQGTAMKEMAAYLGIPAKTDVDLMTSQVTWTKIAKRCGLDPQSFDFVVHMMSGLKSIDPSGSRYLLRSSSRARYRFCPECLRDQAIKHFELHWRFNAWRWCPLHNCLMEEACPHCNAKVRLPGNMLNAGPKTEGVALLSRCLRCGRDLAANWLSTKNKVKFNQLTSIERLLIQNGRAVLAAFAERRLKIGKEEHYSPLVALKRVELLGLIPHSNFQIWGDFMHQMQQNEE
jgi:hypothetical protein